MNDASNVPLFESGLSVPSNWKSWDWRSKLLSNWRLNCRSESVDASENVSNRASIRCSSRLGTWRYSKPPGRLGFWRKPSLANTWPNRKTARIVTKNDLGSGRKAIVGSQNGTDNDAMPMPKQQEQSDHPWMLFMPTWARQPVKMNHEWDRRR